MITQAQLDEIDMRAEVFVDQSFLRFEEIFYARHSDALEPEDVLIPEIPQELEDAYLPQ